MWVFGPFFSTPATWISFSQCQTPIVPKAMQFGSTLSCVSSLAKLSAMLNTIAQRAWLVLLAASPSESKCDDTEIRSGSVILH